MPTETELLPRSLLFSNPERTSVMLSPEGRHLTWLAPLDGVMNIWVAPVDDLDAAWAVTHDTGRGIHAYSWACNEHDILYIQDRNGDENWHVHRVNIDSGDHVDLTPIDGIAAVIAGTSYQHPNTVLVGINDRNEQLHDLYRIDLDTTERTLLAENPGFTNVIVDNDLQVRFAEQMEADGSTRLFKYEQGNWEPFDSIPYDDTMTTRVLGFDQSNERLIMIDSRDQDTASLTLHTIAGGDTKVLLNDPRADVADVMIQPYSRTIDAAAVNYEREHWTILNDDIKADFDYLRKLDAGEFSVVSRTKQDEHWVVVYTKSDGPARYYLLHRNERRAQYLFSDRPKLEGKPLTPMQPEIIRARDGRELVSYLTLPPAEGASDRSRPTQPLPMVLLVHGGPWGRDEYCFNAGHQWLANRGYAVLSVNFRGSVGFGKSFLNSADREWGRAMHDDLIDAVDWAVAEKIADADKVAIMGGSYGGYAALAGLTFTPTTFACAISIVGPSNLVTLLESIPPYWEPMIEMFANRVGDHRTEEGQAFLQSRSPLTYVDHIQRPLLIGQGANDPRVKQRESDQIVDAMCQRGIPVTYALFPDEGHGFVRPQNDLAFNAVAEGFLGACLGGRVEPLGEDLTGSSLQVPQGAEHVAGLDKALSDND